ncbi:beta family protein [Amycolatopsis sp. CA-230715]|uniref:beta family protein n=1 Tax=Amycolatopsis sp. CA-230715 TaxID=2745196 RepID=UPI001C03626C|nr:beta family protein [Amycolatopsis sp. CA-230715]QWF77192.1 hypothetical protein HUW46_00575 [Amycolatopsis sp. CA-230715]
MHSGRPLVAVKCKLGELDALGNLRSRRDAQVRVMVELLDSTSPSGRLLPSLVRAATSLARFGRTLWLDTTWLTSRSPLIQQPRGVFEYLDACIESAVENEHGLFASHLPSLVPVISLDASNDELRRARRLIEHKYRDIAIRIRYPARSKRDLGKRIESIMRSTGTQPGQVHAVVDAGFIETIQASHVTSTANVAATTLDLLGPGHTTLLAGSIPKVRATYATVLRDRPEVTLWNEIHQDGTRELNYGDYGVTHPTPSMTGGNARSPFPYLCYTVPQKTVVLRRKQEKGDLPAELFADLVEELVERDDFAGPDYSWGDSELARCRHAGGRTAGSVSRWVAMATSHHLEHVSRRTATDL